MDLAYANIMEKELLSNINIININKYIVLHRTKGFPISIDPLP